MKIPIAPPKGRAVTTYVPSTGRKSADRDPYEYTIINRIKDPKRTEYTRRLKEKS